MSDPAIIKNKLDFIKEARRVLALFQDPVWAATDEKSDEEHVADFVETLAKTREHFDLPEKTAINAVLGEDDTILAMAGNSPESSERARAIVGFLHSMPYLLNEVERALHLDERIIELLQSNNEKLIENRAQRATIRTYEARESWLLEKLSDTLLSPPDFENMPEFS